MNEPHLRRLLTSYVTYYHADHTHLGLQKDALLGRSMTPSNCAAMLCVLIFLVSLGARAMRAMCLK